MLLLRVESNHRIKLSVRILLNNKTKFRSFLVFLLLEAKKLYCFKTRVRNHRARNSKFIGCDWYGKPSLCGEGGRNYFRSFYKYKGSGVVGRRERSGQYTFENLFLQSSVKWHSMLIKAFPKAHVVIHYNNSCLSTFNRIETLVKWDQDRLRQIIRSFSSDLICLT